MRWLLIALSPVLLAATPDECRLAERAHARLLAGSFETERHFRISVNGKLAKRQVVRVAYAGGLLETEVLEEETLSRGIVLDDDKDPALAIPFACERLTSPEPGRFDLASEDGTETIRFVLDEARDALRPERWVFRTRERFLFKRLDIEGSAEYHDFEWRPTE